MAFAHGSRAVFKLDTSGDVLTDLSAYIRSVKIDQEARIVDRSVPGLQVVKEVGRTEGVVLVEGILDAAIVTHFQNMWVDNAARDMLYDFEYGPQGSDAGKVKLTGKVRLGTYHIGTPVDDAGTFTATLVLANNVVTATTY